MTLVDFASSNRQYDAAYTVNYCEKCSLAGKQAKTLSAAQPYVISCLAIRAYRLANGEIDTKEIERFLTGSAGPSQWLATVEWLFTPPPISTRPGLLTVPVVCPERAASRIKIAAIDEQRVHGEHIVAGTERRQWEWLAFQVRPTPNGRGYFPWEGQTGVGTTHD